MSLQVWDFVFTAMLLLLVMDILYPASCIVANGPVGLAGRNASLTAVSSRGRRPYRPQGLKVTRYREHGYELYRPSGACHYGSTYLGEFFYGP